MTALRIDNIAAKKIKDIQLQYEYHEITKQDLIDEVNLIITEYLLNNDCILISIYKQSE